MLQKKMLLSEEASDDTWRSVWRDFCGKDSMGSQIVGKQSIAFQNAVYIAGSASVVGPKEAAGPLGEWFDVKDGDPLFGKETWEQAESEMQSIALQKAAEKAKLELSEVRFLFGGDLLAQHRDVVWKRGGEASAVRALRCVLDLCGIPDARGDERGGRLCRACSGCDLESLRKCGERISFPARLWKSAAARSNVDRDRERCVYPWHKEWLRTDQRCYTREDC